MGRGNPGRAAQAGQLRQEQRWRRLPRRQNPCLPHLLEHTQLGEPLVLAQGETQTLLPRSSPIVQPPRPEAAPSLLAKQEEREMQPRRAWLQHGASLLAANALTTPAPTPARQRVSRWSAASSALLRHAREQDWLPGHGLAPVSGPEGTQHRRHGAVPPLHSLLVSPTGTATCSSSRQHPSSSGASGPGGRARSQARSPTARRAPRAGRDSPLPPPRHPPHATAADTALFE